ncbi:TIGR04282 family arsenosugar biosynthesis glycosyltransferase [Aquibaculum sediminis]|uniref:TIGR04282 family arsenosugar biosynthesis glycosyltransferase n=1 Tax=Aquibaculum sediminis TaxID=3231907 RepID=UPI003452B2C7
MTRSHNRLIVMCRQPRFGQGKQRLAREVGQLAAWRFQRIALAELLRRVTAPREWRLEVAVTPDVAARGSGRWASNHPRRLQGRGDLGQRMLNLLAPGPGRKGPALLIGADVPGIDAAAVRRAFFLLRRHDWVLGPAEDGGFWAIGARCRPWQRPDLSGVAWGSESVLQDTRARLPGSLALLEQRYDVDDAQALKRCGAGRRSS